MTSEGNNFDIESTSPDCPLCNDPSKGGINCRICCMKRFGTGIVDGDDRAVEGEGDVESESKFLREFNGSVEITSRTIRALTGHAFMGEYYRRFVPTERVKCPCGHRIQTRDHIIMDCVLHENARHHLRKVTRSLSIPIILGTDKGLTAFAKFLANTDAFSKLFEAAT